MVYSYIINCRECSNNILAGITTYSYDLRCLLCMWGYSYGWFCSETCMEKHFQNHNTCENIVSLCSYCTEGRMVCTICGGEGQIETTGPCTAHTITSSHYYCTSSSHHGNNVSEYH